jgi:GNAT superfamily N-acetyltransferase
MYTIERLVPPVPDSDLQDLARLLVHVVESGAAVSFLPPLPLARAEAWWRETLSTATSGSVFLVARDEQGILGTVQLHPAWAPNQPHRADIAKLMVHSRGRRMGVASRLMEAIETAAQRSGLRLLTLDTKRGDAAEQLYRRRGWITAGAIPGYALDPDGAPHDTVIFYKELPPPDAPGAPIATR